MNNPVTMSGRYGVIRFLLKIVIPLTICGEDHGKNKRRGMGYGIISGRFVNDKSHLYFDLQEQKTVSAHDRNGFDIRQVHPSTLTWKDFVDNIIPVTRRSS